MASKTFKKGFKGVRWNYTIGSNELTDFKVTSAGPSRNRISFSFLGLR